jgi:hypothetical protein
MINRLIDELPDGFSVVCNGNGDFLMTDGDAIKQAVDGEDVVNLKDYLRPSRWKFLYVKAVLDLADQSTELSAQLREIAKAY